jgi:uncharacterized membrane protein YciS (DUF1049 family)
MAVWMVGSVILLVGALICALGWLRARQRLAAFEREQEAHEHSSKFTS